VILAPHMGEELIPQLAAAGAAAVPAFLVLWRARIDRIGKAVRRQRRGPDKEE
jgi:hypothetical protein